MRRHDLLRVLPATWDAMLVRYPHLGDLPLVTGWARQGWPVIVRRRLAADASGDIPAALPLPPAYGKRRIAFGFPGDADLQALPPVSLRDAAHAAPPEWQPLIDEIIQLGEAVEVMPRVFGSLLWQHTTGLSYIAAGSDLDLLWSGTNHASMRTLAGELQRLDEHGAVRIDGEIEMPDGAAFNWRELAERRDDDTVLLKTMAGVELRAIGDLFRGPVA